MSRTNRVVEIYARERRRRRAARTTFYLIRNPRIERIDNKKMISAFKSLPKNVQLNHIPVLYDQLYQIIKPTTWFDDETINGYLSTFETDEVKCLSTFFFTTLTGSSEKECFNYNYGIELCPRIY